jgi:hypothetical protein
VLNKLSALEQIHLPPCNDVSIPWEVVATDLIGPLTIKVPQGRVEFQAATHLYQHSNNIMRDCLHWEKFLRACGYMLPISYLLLCAWSRSQILQCCFSTHSNIAWYWQLIYHHQESSNEIYDCMHATIDNMLYTLYRETPPVNIVTAIKQVDSVLASTQYGIHSMAIMYHLTLGITPGILYSCVS